MPAGHSARRGAAGARGGGPAAVHSAGHRRRPRGGVPGRARPRHARQRRRTTSCCSISSSGRSAAAPTRSPGTPRAGSAATSIASGSAPKASAAKTASPRRTRTCSTGARSRAGGTSSAGSGRTSTPVRRRRGRRSACRGWRRTGSRSRPRPTSAARGRTEFRLETEYSFLLTNRLILQPIVELSVFGKDDPGARDRSRHQHAQRRRAAALRVPPRARALRGRDVGPLVLRHGGLPGGGRRAGRPHPLRRRPALLDVSRRDHRIRCGAAGLRGDRTTPPRRSPCPTAAPCRGSRATHSARC